MQIINLNKIAEGINSRTVKEILKSGKRPNLAIISVGEDSAAAGYLDNEIETAKRVGIDTHLYKCDSDTGGEKIAEMIRFLNDDPEIDAIRIQLPFPGGLDASVSINALSPEKDVDGMRNESQSAERMEEDGIYPPFFKAVILALGEIGFDYAAKSVLIISGKGHGAGNLSVFLEGKGAISTVISPKEARETNALKTADLIIASAGNKNLIRKEMIRKEAVILDIGSMTELGSGLSVADLDEVDGQAGYLAQIASGMDALTVAITLSNTLALHKKLRG